MSLKTRGTITKILPTQTGESAKGEWKKTSFVLDTKEEYNNIYCFDIFGAEKVDEFLKYNKEGKDVEVDFNVRTNEYNGKYYTSLQAWKVFKSEPVSAKEQAPDRETSDLPF